MYIICTKDGVGWEVCEEDGTIIRTLKTHEDALAWKRGLIEASRPRRPNPGFSDQPYTGDW